MPSHAWNRWRYHYPQAAFPYADLIAENTRRGKLDPEYELLDTGVFDDDRYWIVEVDYAKADPTDLLMTVRVTNAGPDAATLHVLPTVWFRNTWSWDLDAPKPELHLGAGGRIDIDHPFLGPLELLADAGARRHRPDAAVLREPDQRGAPVRRRAGRALPQGRHQRPRRVGPRHGEPRRGRHQGVGLVPGRGGRGRDRGAAAAGCARPTRPPVTPRRSGHRSTRSWRAAQREADDFYAEMTPAATTDDEARVMRQAFAGMLWSKQLYNYDVARWLAGDPTQPTPPASRLEGRNTRWGHFESFDIMSMPDKWEYPWFAAWDLGFHCVALAHVDPAFAKYQLLLVCREWFQHPSGALPAYEWDFGDVNPPVQAWAALEVFAIDGGRDLDFLSKVFDKLLVNFTWWVNQEDVEGTNLFEGGFLGLDNIGPLDRSHLPVGGTLQQSDASGWMAFYALAMGSIASILNRAGRRPATDLVLKFLEHFAAIRTAMAIRRRVGRGRRLLLRPAAAARRLEGAGPGPLDGRHHPAARRRSSCTRTCSPGRRSVDKRFAQLLEESGKADFETLEADGLLRGDPGERHLMLGVVGVDHLRKLLGRLFDEAEFLSPHGLRAVSAYHRDHPYRIDVEGFSATIDYEPAESTTSMFGGNSNWRGPIWFPLNFLLVSALERYYRFFGPDFVIEYPTGSGRELPLDEISDDIRRRLVSLFLVDADGRRPCFGGVERLQTDPAWKDNLVFNEYFHGDNGAGLGAAHQTGWTGLVADLIRGRPGNGVYTVGEVARHIDRQAGG